MIQWRKTIVLLVVVALSAWALAVQADDHAEDEDFAADASVAIMNPDGETIGEVFFYEEDGIVYVDAFVEGLEPGFHGFHIHGTGECTAEGDSPFSSAGGHWNPEGTSHSDHPGDLPSLLALQDGSAYLSFATDRFMVADLFDEDGSAMIIHAGPDNYGNIPERYGGPDEATLGAGDAGARVACGVIQEGDMMMDMEDEG